MARQMITFVLDTVRDRDIIHWLEGQENKSAGIREAIRPIWGAAASPWPTCTRQSRT
jgi:hypothetical protein